MYGLEDESVPWGQISGYLLRARAILVGRAPEQIHWGGLVIDWFLCEAVPELQIEVRNRGLQPAIDQDEPTLSELVRLRRYMVIDGMDYFPEATWPELLAAYTLSRIGQAHGTFQLKKDLEPRGSDLNMKLIRSLDNDFLTVVLEASEAVHFAERIGEVQEDAQAEAELLITQQQRDKGVKRHAATTRLSNDFIASYVRDGGGNRSAAARKFLDGLSEDDRNEFTTDDENAIQTLTRKLRKWPKDHPSGSSESDTGVD